MWFILRGDLFYVLPCVNLFLCLSVLLALRLACFGKRQLILVCFVRLFDLYLFLICRFPLPLGVWEGLWFVIVALSALFLTVFSHQDIHANTYNETCSIYENSSIMHIPTYLCFHNILWREHENTHDTLLTSCWSNY